MSIAVLEVGKGDERSHESLKANVPEPKHHLEVDDIGEGWEQVLATDADFVFHHPAGFVYAQPVPLDRIVSVLRRHSYLVQIALRVRRSTGGAQKVRYGDIWVEHRDDFVTTPCVYPAALCYHGWSDGLSEQLLADSDARFAVWGSHFAGPLAALLDHRHAAVLA